EGVRRDPITPEAEAPTHAPWIEEEDPELTPEEEEEAPLVGDRGISQVGAKFGSTGKGKLLGGAALLAIGAFAIYAVAAGGDGKTKA
ncbi:hypothetical protein OK509_10610, partial [Streptococcus pneumoniae]|nr:hypothetical protein [Streptococcus pneumoniae]